MEARAYGLELTNNSKVGWAFSLSRNKTCIGATEVCRKYCYCKGIRYQSTTQKEKRERNYRTVEYLLELGGPELLAENLVLLVDHARPLDWLSARYTDGKTAVPWTFRLHDAGDFHSARYVEAWFLTAQKRPECQFWFYTRSFIVPQMLDSLTKLCQLPNCQGFLSVDSDNYKDALAAYRATSGWKIAIMQEAPGLMPAELFEDLKEVVPVGQTVSFPCHHGGRHVEPIEDESWLLCPQVMGFYSLESRPNMAKPCQRCKFCLP